MSATIVHVAGVPIATDKDGCLTFCPSCYPMLGLHPSFPLHTGHHRHGFPHSKGVSVYDGDDKLDNVEEYVELDGVPGALLREWVRADGAGAGADWPEKLVRCYRNGHVDFLRRLRYAPNARIVRADHST